MIAEITAKYTRCEGLRIKRILRLGKKDSKRMSCEDLGFFAMYSPVQSWTLTLLQSPYLTKSLNLSTQVYKNLIKKTALTDVSGLRLLFKACNAFQNEKKREDIFEATEAAQNIVRGSQ